MFRRNESGYVLPTTALLLIPMMIFAAFAVDVGAWYAEAGRIQRAADAAALAAVVHMPDTTAASAAAVDAAGRNGFQNGVDGVVVTVSAIGQRGVHVDIKAEAPVYLGGIVIGSDTVDITRFGEAEYVLAVPMGNPTSSIGTADITLDGTTPPANYWLNAHAYNFGASAGDLLNSFNSNPYYRDDGYIYVIEKPAGVEVVVESMHSGRCKRPNWPSSGVGEHHNTNNPLIDFKLYAADDTPRNHQDNIDPTNEYLAPGVTSDFAGNTLGDSTGASCPSFNADGTWADPQWLPLFTIPAAAPGGNWYLTASTPIGSNGHKNMYGLRVSSPNIAVGYEYCSELNPASFTGSCPTINALDFLSLYIGENRPDPTAGTSPALFYFAEIDEVHAGKVLQISLWDPAEGSQFLQFLDPFGTPMAFRYRDQDINGNPAAAAWTNTAAVCPEDGSTSHCMPTTGGNPFHNRMVTIQVPLVQPDGTVYECDAGNCWWQVNYDSTGSVDDTTTWAVEIIGDPIRLTE